MACLVTYLTSDLAKYRSAAAFDEDWRKVLKSREEREGDSEGKSGSGPPVLAMAITPLSEASPSGQELSGKGIKKLDTTERDCGRVSASTVERPSASAQDQSEASTSGCLTLTHVHIGNQVLCSPRVCSAIMVSLKACLEQST